MQDTFAHAHNKGHYGAIHKGRPQNVAIFHHPAPTSAKFGLLHFTGKINTGVCITPFPIVRMSFMVVSKIPYRRAPPSA